MRTLSTTARTLLAPALLGLAMFGSMAAQAADLVPPKGYLTGVEKPKKGEGNFSCEAVPTPYTQSLQFRSKYEGSDKARSTLNEESEKAFRDATHDITTMERGISKVVMQYMRDGRAQQLDCALQWLGTWAKAGALESTDFNHTGKSMRKWALGSMAGSYIRLKFAEGNPLAAHQQQAQEIEAWFSKLARQTISDWDGLPLKKINNHSYWAAWSVMATAVATNDRELFDWSVKEFKIGASQVDADGYLPNELRRNQRALAYHNYALPPLAMIASFAAANQVDLRHESQDALERLGTRVLDGATDPEGFNERTGKKQDMTELKDESKWAWLEPYCQLYTCNPAVMERKHEGQPFKTFRLGGDMTRVYDPEHDKDDQGS